MGFPFSRNRRLRSSEGIRSLVTETTLSASDFVMPMFITSGRGIVEPLASLPGISRRSVDEAVKECKELFSLGIRAVNIYVKVPEELKDNTGKESWNPQGLMQEAISEIKSALPEMVVMPDVALDPYSSYGHDGIIKNGEIDNDSSIEALAKMAVSHAKAGADIVAPSDMMDGRVNAIRLALEDAGYPHVGILSYAVKYASAFYGPFRSALDSAPRENADAPKDKKTYQMNPANKREALYEARLDAEEGADILMIKPGIPYLDVVHLIREKFDLPIAVFHVSGEYAMLKAAAEKGWVDNDRAILETLISIKRAGADMIFTYAAKEAAALLSK